MTCVGPGSDSKKAAPGSVAVTGGRTLRSPAGSVAVAGVRMLRSPQSGSLQPGMIGGIGGKLGAEGIPPAVWRIGGEVVLLIAVAVALGVAAPMLFAQVMRNRARLNQAWTDLFGSWPYHDAYLGMLLDHFNVNGVNGVSGAIGPIRARPTT